MLRVAASTARVANSLLPHMRWRCNVHTLGKLFLSSSTSRQPASGPAPLSFRRAVPSDKTFILQLANRLSHFPVPPWRVPEHINRADDAIMLADLHNPLPANFFLIAERLLYSGREPRAGFVFASSRQDYFTGQRHAHVETMAVGLEHEGCGVAKALLDACEGWARSRGDEFVTLNVWFQNSRARGVYERLGWQPETVHYRKALK